MCLNLHMTIDLSILSLWLCFMHPHSWQLCILVNCCSIIGGVFNSRNHFAFNGSFSDDSIHSSFGYFPDLSFHIALLWTFISYFSLRLTYNEAQSWILKHHLIRILPFLWDRYNEILQTKVVHQCPFIHRGYAPRFLAGAWNHRYYWTLYALCFSLYIHAYYSFIYKLGTPREYNITNNKTEQ